MLTKEELITNIKEWIKLDNEITKLQSEMKIRKHKKKELSDSLVEVMKKNTIDCFDIAGGSLMYKKNKVKKPINGKSLVLALQNYYKDTPQVAEDITNHIMSGREEQVKETISRKMKKCPPVEQGTN
jgi:DNA primase catalytic subunit